MLSFLLGHYLETCLLDHREVYVYEKLPNGFQNGYTILDSRRQCVKDQVQFLTGVWNYRSF